MPESTNDGAKTKGYRDKDVKRYLRNQTRKVPRLRLKTVEVTGVKAKVLISFVLPSLKVQPFSLSALFTPISCTLLSCLIRCFRKFKVMFSGAKRDFLTINILHLTAMPSSSKHNESKGNISNHVLDVNVCTYRAYCYSALLPLYV